MKQAEGEEKAWNHKRQRKYPSVDRPDLHLRSHLLPNVHAQLRRASEANEETRAPSARVSAGARG